MTDFFREVDEDVRRERALQLLSKYQYLFIGLAVVLVAATAAWSIWDTRRTAAAEAAGGRYEAALQLAHDGKSAEAQAAFDALAKEAPPGYRTLAKLRAADELAAHDPEAARKAYDALASEPGYDPAFQDVARLRSAMLFVDQADPKEVEQKLSPLATGSFPYRNSVRELLALAALKRDDFAAAGRWLDAIVTDPAAPAALRQRAEAFLSLVQAGKLGSK